MTHEVCAECSCTLPAAADRCPHCGRPGLFPNVRAAKQPTQRAALRRRYEAAIADAERRGAKQVVEQLERELESSCAVVARRIGEIERLASSERQGYSTYYQLIEADNRLPDDDAWDPLRRMADAGLFPGYAKDIRFLALSLDEAGLDSYGDCFLVCNDAMIEHRASVFEANSAGFLRKTSPDELAAATEGRKAPYEDRAVLGIAKLAAGVNADTNEDEFAGILMHAGTTTAEDEFIEVHVYGPMTIRTFRKVVVRDAKLVRKKSVLKALREQLQSWGIGLEVRR